MNKNRKRVTSPLPTYFDDSGGDEELTDEDIGLNIVASTIIYDMPNSDDVETPNRLHSTLRNQSNKFKKDNEARMARIMDGITSPMSGFSANPVFSPNPDFDDLTVPDYQFAASTPVMEYETEESINMGEFESLSNLSFNEISEDMYEKKKDEHEIKAELAQQMQEDKDRNVEEWREVYNNITNNGERKFGMQIFERVCQNQGINISEDDKLAVYSIWDKSGHGTLTFKEFYDGIHHEDMLKYLDSENVEQKFRNKILNSIQMNHDWRSQVKEHELIIEEGDNGLEKLRPIQKKVLITNVSGAYSTFELKQHTADLQKEIKEEFEEHTRQFETKLKVLYDMATENGTKDYTMERFKTICKHKEPSVTEELLDKSWTYFDTDSNGVLSFEEYKKGMLTEEILPLLKVLDEKVYDEVVEMQTQQEGINKTQTIQFNAREVKQLKMEELESDVAAKGNENKQLKAQLEQYKQQENQLLKMEDKLEKISQQLNNTEESLLMKNVKIEELQNLLKEKENNIDELDLKLEEVSEIKENMDSNLKDIITEKDGEIEKLKSAFATEKDEMLSTFNEKEELSHKKLVELKNDKETSLEKLRIQITDLQSLSKEYESQNIIKKANKASTNYRRIKDKVGIYKTVVDHCASFLEDLANQLVKKGSNLSQEQREVERNSIIVFLKSINPYCNKDPQKRFVHNRSVSQVSQSRSLSLYNAPGMDDEPHDHYQVTVLGFFKRYGESVHNWTCVTNRNGGASHEFEFNRKTIYFEFESLLPICMILASIAKLKIRNPYQYCTILASSSTAHIQTTLSDDFKLIHAALCDGDDGGGEQKLCDKREARRFIYLFLENLSKLHASF